MSYYTTTTVSGVACRDLTDAGAMHAESIGLDINTDAYGCAYATDESGEAVDLDQRVRSLVIVHDDATDGSSVLYAGAYTVEHPTSYDPSLIGGEDILCDGHIWVVNE